VGASLISKDPKWSDERVHEARNEVVTAGRGEGPEALVTFDTAQMGRSRGGSGIKVHVVSDGRGSLWALPSSEGSGTRELASRRGP